MIAKFLLRCDLFILQCVCEPFFERIVKCSQRDIFILARRWFMLSYSAIFTYAAYVIMHAEYVGWGIILAIIALSRILMMSRTIWKWIAQFGFSKRIRHPYDREQHKIMYQIYRGEDNPLKLALAYKRMQALSVIFIASVLMMIYVLIPSFTIIYCAFFMCFVGHAIWLYMRSCTIDPGIRSMQLTQLHCL